VLEELHVPVDCIAGTSMGSLVGGLYAAGWSPERLEAEMVTIDWYDLFSDRPRRQDLSFRRKEDDISELVDLEIGVKRTGLTLPRGLIAGQKIGSALEWLTLPMAGIDDFDRLNLPFRAVATDLGTGDMVVLRRGSLPEAMRASMAIPGAIAPVEWEGRILVDGGLVRNLPVDVARAMGADVVIAVDVSTPLDRPELLKSVRDVARQVSGMLTRLNVETQAPAADLLIVPALRGITSGAYHKAAAAVTRGAASARAHADALRGYALPPDAWEAWRARQRAAAALPARIDAVRIEGESRVDRRVLERRIRARAGDPLAAGTVKEDVARLFGLGDFERVDFTLDEHDGSTDLVYRTRDKSWGPNYLRLGLNLRNDLQGDTDFNIAGRLTATRLDALGAEWRTDAQFGETRRIYSEFYQPLDFGGIWFVAPAIDYASVRTDVFDGDQRVAIYQTRVGTGILAFGANMGKYGEVRAGVTRGRARAIPTVGGAGLERLDVPIAGLVGRIVVDRFDRPSFPNQGRYAVVRAFFPRQSLGSDLTYDKVSGSFVQVFSHRRHHTFVGLDGGTNLGSDIPFYDQFPLGGLLSLSGYRESQLRGQVFGVARVGYYRRSGRLSGDLARGFAVYAGAWLEAGNAWASTKDISTGNLIYTGTLAVGLDTYLGPILLAYGHSDDGHSSVYLSMGRSLGGNRLFDFGAY
jgi:NTE family protein